LEAVEKGLKAVVDVVVSVPFVSVVVVVEFG
jgi:hypothetical protein